MVRTILATACVFTMAGPALGSALAEDPDPRVLLRKADQALREAPTLTFTAHRLGAGALATRSPDAEADVQLKRIGATDPVGWAFAVRGSAAAYGQTPAREVLAAYDGEAVRSVRAHDREVFSAPPDRVREAVQDDAWHVLSWLLRWEAFVTRPFVDHDLRIEARYDGRAVVDGVDCHIVHVDLGNIRGVLEYDIRWFLGVEDHLPRRYDAYFYAVDGSYNGFEVVRLSGLEAGGAVDESLFTPATPEGYELREYEPPEAAQPRAARQRQGALVGREAPDFTLQDPEGIAHTLSEYKGKVVVLDFWATWCGPCIRAMPALQSLHERYAQRGVAVIGVNAWENGDPVKLKADRGFTYALLLEGDQVAQRYGVSGIPAFFVIGVDGKVIHQGVGFSPSLEDQLARVIEAHLDEHGM